MKQEYIAPELTVIGTIEDITTGSAAGKPKYTGTADLYGTPGTPFSQLFGDSA
jgi:hypothetical protein